MSQHFLFKVAKRPEWHKLEFLLPSFDVSLKIVHPLFKRSRSSMMKSLDTSIVLFSDFLVSIGEEDGVASCCDSLSFCVCKREKLMMSLF